jgi:hypothetical protein
VTTTIDPDHQRLLQRNIDDDTRILSAKSFRVDGIPILKEKWIADGVSGRSVVLLAESVSALDDVALQNFLRDQAGIDLGASVTITRNDTHVFVNYDFEAI